MSKAPGYRSATKFPCKGLTAALSANVWTHVRCMFRSRAKARASEGMMYTQAVVGSELGEEQKVCSSWRVRLVRSTRILRASLGKEVGKVSQCLKCGGAHRGSASHREVRPPSW